MKQFIAILQMGKVDYSIPLVGYDQEFIFHRDTYQHGSQSDDADLSWYDLPIEVTMVESLKKMLDYLRLQQFAKHWDSWLAQTNKGKKRLSHCSADRPINLKQLCSKYVNMRKCTSLRKKLDSSSGPVADNES